MGPEDLLGLFLRSYRRGYSVSLLRKKSALDLCDAQVVGVEVTYVDKDSENVGCDEAIGSGKKDVLA